MKYLFVFKIYFLTLFLANAQNKIIPLYPEGVPAENSIKYYLALRKHKIPSAIHIWEGGENVVGLAKNHKGLFKNWPKTSDRWMIERKLINN